MGGTTKPMIATVVACLAALAAALLPWLRTGQARRSAFALARSADALGFIDSPVRRGLVVAWYLLPFLTAAVWTAAAVQRPGATAAIGAVVGAMSIAAGAIVIALVKAETGPVAAIATGGVALGSSAWLAAERRRTMKGMERGGGVT